MNLAARDACRANPDPVNMDSFEVVCWECGEKRTTSRDDLGRAFCEGHRHLWGSVPTPAEFRNQANGPW